MNHVAWFDKNIHLHWKVFNLPDLAPPVAPPQEMQSSILEKTTVLKSNSFYAENTSVQYC